MRYDIRPLGPFAGRQWTERRQALFRASWADTLELLGYEVDRLGGTLVVVQVDADPADIRNDGMLRARARVGLPAVKVSFESRHGWLTYATDAFDDWRDNVRAVALSLQALRAVDRYGVAGSGEQYRGWAQLPAAPAASPVQAAAVLLAEHTVPPLTAVEILADREVAALAFKRAARAHHPDVGGDRGLFERLVAARDLLLEAIR